MNQDKPKTLLDANAGGLAFVIGILTMLSSELTLVTIIKDSDTLSLVFSYVSQALFFASAVFTTVYFSRSFPSTFNALGVRKPKPALVLLSILIPLASIFAFLPVSQAVEFVFAKMGYVNTPSYADYTKSVGALFYVGIGLCVFPAFGEEFMMRGALMRGLREKGTAYAIIMSALAFGIMHGSPTQFIHQFLIGVIMAYLVYITDCLWYSVIFHFVNNTTVVLYNYAVVTSGAEFTIPFYVYIIMFIVGVCLLGFLVYLFVKKIVGNDVTGVKALFKSSIEKAEVGVVAYNKKPAWAFYIGMAVILFLFLFNTISGWSK